MVLEDSIGKEAALKKYQEDWELFNQENYDPQCSPPDDLYKNPKEYGAPVLSDYIHIREEEPEETQEED